MSVAPTTPIQADPRTGVRGYDVQKVRRDFPILSTTTPSGKPLVYLDNGATTQKPRTVIDRIVHYYERENANIHRGVYQLSQNATRAYDETREKVARFINAPDTSEVIFVRGTTEGVNLVANSYGRSQFRSGDEILIGAQEHHSDIVPWQMIAQQTGAVVRVIPMNDAGELLLDELQKLLSDKTKLVAVAHLSNSLGTINDVRRISEMAHRVGAKVLVDGAQWVAHFPTDVREIGCDFYTFSGHKLFGPTGIGVLWGGRELLEAMPPFMGGGDMIESVTFDKTTYAGLPNKFEAGTPDIAGVVGLGAAIEYVESLGFKNFMPYEHELFNYATRRLQEVPGLRIIGTAKHKASVISFVLENPVLSSLDIGTKLDREGVCVRTGHHCCQPVMERFGISSTARVSLSLYNTREEVDLLVAALFKIRGKDRVTEVTPPRGDAVTFADEAGASPDAVAEELAESFELLGDRDMQVQYLEELGEKLSPMPDILKNDATRVHGCMSVVHLVSRVKPGTADVFQFIADSDASTVRGLIAVLQKLFSGQRATDVLSFDIEAFLKRIQLDQIVTTRRRIGLDGMIKRIRSAASAIVKTGKH